MSAARCCPSPAPRAKQRGTALLINTRDKRVTVESHFISEFHALVSQTMHLRLSPFTDPQPAGLGETGHHLFTSHCRYPHARSEGGVPGGREQPLSAIIAFEHLKRNQSESKGLVVELGSGENPLPSELVLALRLQGTRGWFCGKLV